MRPDELTPPQQAEFINAFNDHQRFCRESLSIRNLDGITVPLELGPGQLKLHAAIDKQLRREQPVRIIVLKSRRTGFTVGSCAEIFHRTPFLPGQRALVIADKYKPAAQEAFDYFLQYQRSYRPFSMHGAGIRLPKIVKDTEECLRWENKSGIDVLSAEGGEVGRGGGYRFVLCDEAAFWRAPEVTLTGVLNSVPRRPGTIVIVQSTANGVGGEFFDQWQRACDPKQATGFVPVFFGWLEHPEYRMPVENPAAFQRSLDDEERVLMDVHNATLEQVAWRRWAIDAQCRSKVDIFHQEFPTTPEEAFLASGRPALDHRALSRMRAQDGTPGSLQVIDEYGSKRIVFAEKAHSELIVWRRPEPGRMYVLGGDPATGIDVSESKRGGDPDYSVAAVLDRDTGEQVAQIRERIRPGIFAQLSYLLGRWYNWAYCVPESNGVGIAYVEELVRLKYPLERIYRRQRDPTDRRSGAIEEIGFLTTNTTRPWLINALDSAIREGSISIRSAVALQECRTLVNKPNGRVEHQSGCHDDCCFALALACFGLTYAPRRAVAMAGVGTSSRRPVKYGEKQRSDDDDD